ncbi:insulinase family protein [Patescibacteria group bacterium]|nr:insulinase family protein [Patescibacteria group bacterium]
MYTLETLHNKTKLLLAPLEGTETVTVLILVKVGSRYESAKLNGISHFVEHLLFKGTKKRPTSLDITKELDGVGASFNAFTAKDHTGYYIKVNHEHLELALDVVSDMLHNSLFAKEEMERERGVIIEEINMYEDNPLLMVDNVFEEAVFAGSSLARVISGSKENIRKISHAEIVNYFKANYAADNVIVAVGGKFNQPKTKKLASQYFNQPASGFKKSSFKKFSSLQKSPRINLKTKATEQVHLALGFPAYKITNPKNYPLLLLAIILGGNMSSRLFLEIREKLGLAYYIKTDLSPYQDTGALAVYAGLDKSKINLAIKTILKELEKAVNKDVTAEELKRSKEYIKGKLILGLEDSAARIQWLAAQQLLKNKIETIDQQLKKVEKVTAGQVRQTAQEIIKNQKINLGIIGPYQDKKKFLKILKNH